MRIVTPALLAVLLVIAAPALACYTGLTVIPNAETLGDGQYGLEIQLDGTCEQSKADTHIINTQFGFGKRLELGLDLDASEGAEGRLLTNAKYLLSISGERVPAVAVGMCNIGNDVKSIPYLAGTYEHSLLRSHLGGMRIEGRNRWFAGIDKGIGERLTLMADYTSGDENYHSFGVNYQIREDSGIMAGIQFPNDSAGDTRFTLHLVLNGSYRHPIGGEL